ncbi:MAG: hypothetical protein V1809_16395 [Planctomycetota bacterium]
MANRKTLMTRVEKVIRRWKSSDSAWLYDASLNEHPLSLRPGNTPTVLAVVESPQIISSGRAMWNLGMWLEDVWDDFKRPVRTRILKTVELIMLRANHNRALGLWKLGDFLGDHLATKEAKRILETVACEANCEEGVKSALHGLAHYAHDHPKGKPAVSAFLRGLARKAGRRQYRRIIRSAIRGIAQGSACGCG